MAETTEKTTANVSPEGSELSCRYERECQYHCKCQAQDFTHLCFHRNTSLYIDPLLITL